MAELVQTTSAPFDASAASTGRVALKGFFAITDRWNLSPGEQRVLLGGVGRTTFAKYRKLPEVALSRDVLERVSYVFGIHKALLILFGSEKRATAWLRKPNREVPFNGSTALQRMLAGNVADLAVVRDYLDAARG